MFSHHKEDSCEAERSILQSVETRIGQKWFRAFGFGASDFDGALLLLAYRVDA